jgi:hypothetical protein
MRPSKRPERGGTLRGSGAGAEGYGDVDDEPDARRSDVERRRDADIDRERSRSWSRKEAWGMDDMETSRGAAGVGEVGEKEKEGGRGKTGSAFQRLLNFRKSSLSGSSRHDEAERERRKNHDERKREQITPAPAPASQIPIRSVTAPNLPTNPPMGQGTMNSQQMFEDKRTRREQRRSYRSSEDFLVIAGANPRTGYWDVTTTVTSTSSSSDPSARARQREKEIEENRRKMEAAKKELEEALVRREKEVGERERRKRESRVRRERRRREVRLKHMKSREGGRWRSEGEGWNMVVEPELSPITQSLAGSSPRRESRDVPPGRKMSADDQLRGMRIPGEAVEHDSLTDIPATPRQGSPQRRYPDRESVPPPQSRLPVTPVRRPHYPSGAPVERAPYTPLLRKPLPNPSRIVSGENGMYDIFPSRTKIGSSRTPIDPMYGFRPHKSPLTGIPQYPSPQKPNQYRVLYGEPVPTRRYELVDPQSQGSTSRSGQINDSNSPSERESKEIAHNESDPFGTVRRTRPGSPPKSDDQPRRSGSEAQPLPTEIPSLMGNIPIRRREIGQDPSGLPSVLVSKKEEKQPRRQEASSETVVHHRVGETLPEILPEALQLHPPINAGRHTPGLAVTTSGETEHQDDFPKVTPEQNSFLGMTPGERVEEEATATPYQPVSTNRALNHPRSLQNLKDTFQARRIKHIASMGDLPPFVLKDPITGTLVPIRPSNFMVPEETGSQNSKEDRVEGGKKDVSTTTTTSIITTTGSDPLRCLPEQTDGTSVAVRSSQPRPRPLSRIPTLGSFPKSIRKSSPSGASPRPPANIDTSSVALTGVTPTKQRTPRWCRKVFLDLGRKGGLAKSTPTSTSISPGQTQSQAQWHLGALGAQRGQSEAQRAARLALRKASAPSISPERSPGQKAGLLRGNIDIGDPSKSRIPSVNGVDILKRRVEKGLLPGSPPMNRGGDGFVVWHSHPPAAMMKKKGHDDIREEMERKQASLKGAVAVATRAKARAQPDAKGQLPLGGMLRAAKQMVVTAWWFVEPVFDANSAFRRRWEQQQPTWHDALLICGACLFGVGALLAAVLCARVVGMALQIVRMVSGACRFLLGG